MEDQHLASLIDLYLAGVLTTDERTELHDWLVSSADARSQYNHHLSGYCITHPGAFAPDVTKAIADLATTQDITTNAPVFMPSPAVASAKLRLWCLGGAMAVSIMIGLALFVHHSLAPVPPYQPMLAVSAGPVASLLHAAAVEWLNFTNEIFRGDMLAAGRLQMAAGSIELGFKRGATLVVEAPADLEIISDNEAFLHSGKVTAHVPETAHGFKITAPGVAVTDLGTEFGLRAVSNAPPEVHVFSGTVETAPPTVRPQRVTEGHALRVRGKRMRNFSPDRTAFLFHDEVLEQEAMEQQERYRNWRNAASELSSDPATLIHYTFEDQSDSARSVANRVWKAPAATAGNLEGCAWTAGRWPDKHAISFNDKKDRLRFNVANTLTSLTYMAWVRIDQLSSRSNALAITETMQLGEVHWQVYRDGRVALSARSGNGATVDQSWDRGLSPPIFTQERLGKWTYLAGVYDSAAHTISHYVNGEFVSATPIKRPVKLKLHAVEIGNWGVRMDQAKWSSMKSMGPDYLNRYWNGSVDEFALLSRAMAPDEIRRYYQQGRISTGALVAKVP